MCDYISSTESMAFFLEASDDIGSFIGYYHDTGNTADPNTLAYAALKTYQNTVEGWAKQCSDPNGPERQLERRLALIVEFFHLHARNTWLMNFRIV